MLNQLSVRNVAVIDKLDINLHDGVSVLTGETGAGKSIIIDSINMILGDRANKELVRYGTDKAVVQAVFDAPKSVINILEEIFFSISRFFDNMSLYLFIYSSLSAYASKNVICLIGVKSA